VSSLDVLFFSWNRLAFTEQTFELLLQNTAWERVRRLLVYDDGSTDGTREYLEAALTRAPIASHFAYVGFGSPVASMNVYLDDDPADAFAKVDNDIAVPPGWLDAMVGVLDGHPELELLGMEAGQTELAGRDGKPWDGVYRYRDCSHIGGVGLMRSSAFLTRPRPVAKGRFGFTEWQHDENPTRGWIEPDLLVPQLDRIPLEPWLSLSESYRARRWQRIWPLMDETWGAPYYDWLRFRCAVCRDTGHVCENHPDHAWAGIADVEACCGGAGAPCPACCSPIPADGRHSISEAFTPDWRRE
jgi:glycosyltransferase involved in cell wall biosynthesis